MSNPVKYFDSTMTGAPQLTNDWGSMTSMLDAVLINGFNLKSVTSLTRVGSTVTAACSGHGYRVGMAVLLAGATPSAYNDDFVVTAITLNTFTFEITGEPATPATGTITAKVAPLGFEIAFTATNKRAYRSPNVESNRPYLRVDDSLDPLYTTTYAKYAKVTMAQGMSDIDTFVGARAPFNPDFPTRNEVATGSGTGVLNGWYKWYYAKAAGNTQDTTTPETYNRRWFVVGDNRGFYLFNETSSTSGLGGKCFTDFDSYRPGDGFNTILCAQDAYGAASSFQGNIDGEGSNSPDWRARFSRTGDTVGKLAMRSHIQVGANVGVSFTSLNTNNSSTTTGLGTGVSWPNGPDYGLLLHPVFLRETTNIRGKLPGMLWVHNDSPTLQHLTVLEGVSGFPGKKIIMVACAHGTGVSNFVAMFGFDITGPWR